MILAEGLDLEQVDDDQDADFLIKNGVKRGIARCFVSDTGLAKRYKRSVGWESLTRSISWVHHYLVFSLETSFFRQVRHCRKANLLGSLLLLVRLDRQD